MNMSVFIWSFLSKKTLKQKVISKGIYIICFKIAIKVHAYQACDIRNKKQKQESRKKIQGFLIKYKEKIREAGFPGK